MTPAQLLALADRLDEHAVIHAELAYNDQHRQWAADLRAAAQLARERAEAPEPLGWMRPDELQQSTEAPRLCRVHPEKDRQSDMVPVYLHPPAAQSQSEPTRSSISDLERICAESYQVVGWLADECGLFDDDAVIRALDNLSEQRLVHENVLPFAPERKSEPTMDDAIAAGDGTLHGAIDYWQERALRAEAAQPQSDPPITCPKCAAEHPAASFAAGYISAVGQCQQCDEKPASEPFDNADDLIAYLHEPRAPNPDEVICPACAHQFRAIPENVRAALDRMSAENEALRAACQTTLMLRQLGGMLPGVREVIGVAVSQAEAALAQAKETTIRGANRGHGHVHPRPDGVKARCGGPAICPECAREQAQMLAQAKG